MTVKEEYISFCLEQDWIPIFQKPFWWDAVLADWQVKRFTHQGAIAYLPNAHYKKWGFSFSRNPFLTPYSGLLFKEQDYDAETKNALFSQATQFLEQFAISQYDLHPLHSKGIQSEHTRTTFLLELNRPLEEIENDFKSSLKRQLKKAEKSLRITDAEDSQVLYSIYKDSMQRQAAYELVPEALAHHVFELCKDRDVGKIFLARDTSNQVHAAIWYVEDNNCAYYLLGGSDSNYLGSGAMGLLLRHCIQQAHKSNKSFFDFEGSDVPGVARFFSTFGGERINYPILKTKTNPKLDLLLKLKNKLKA